MWKQFGSVPFGLFIMFLLDAVGVFFIQANNVGLAFIVFTSAYVFCVTGFYVIYRVLRTRGW